MTKEEYKEIVTTDVVNRIFRNHVIIPGTAPRFVITVCGKILTIDGKIFFDSHEKAMRAFYNSFNWRVKRELWDVTHQDSADYYGWWRNPDARNSWEAFKDVIKEGYGFCIMEV